MKNPLHGSKDFNLRPYVLQTDLLSDKAQQPMVQQVQIFIQSCKIVQNSRRMSNSDDGGPKEPNLLWDKLAKYKTWINKENNSKNKLKCD